MNLLMENLTTYFCGVNVDELNSESVLEALHPGVLDAIGGAGGNQGEFLSTLNLKIPQRSKVRLHC